MRIIKLIFFSLLFISIASLLVFFVGREILLSMGVSSIRNSLKELSAISRNSGPYAIECRKKGIIEIDESSIKTIQIRFISDTVYQIEVVCSQFSLNPIVVKSVELPQFVKKTAGFSGITWGENLSGLAIESFGKVKSIFVEDYSIRTGTLEDVQGSLSPVTSCEGQGFECCQADTTIGQGEQINNVLDCPQSCFTSCVKRPVVLSVSTQPFFDLKTRVLTATKSEQIIAAYVMDPAGSKELDVTIDFGDGTTEHRSEYNGDATHQYNCSKSSCRYNLQVTAVNEDGIEAARTSITSVTVIVQ